MTARTIVTHDGVPVHVAADEDGALRWLLRHQGQSWDYALKHGGYALIQAEPWDEDEAKSVRRSAVGIFTDPWHKRGHDGDDDRVTRENCAACVLAGYGEDSEDIGPNYGAWARVYVEGGRPIPARWKRAFAVEFRSSDNERYRDALRRSVATFGVVFS